MNKLWKFFLPLLIVTLLAGCGNFKDTIATSSLDNRESDRFKNMPIIEKEQLPENSYTHLGKARTKFSRPKHITNYNLIKQDARRSLKIKAVRMGGNAITDLKCEKRENKGWQDELTDTENKTSKFGVGWLSRYSVIVTNYHTIKGSDNIFIALPTGKKMQARVVKQDPGNNIAILSPEKKLFERNGLPLADSKASAGSEVFVLGFSASSHLQQDPKIIKGVLNSTSGFRGDPRTYRITSSLEKGYSGSPLLNPQGKVLGIVIQNGSAPELFPGQKELSPDEHYAVKISYLKSMLDEHSKTSTVNSKEKPISTLQENIFTVIAK